MTPVATDKHDSLPSRFRRRLVDGFIAVVVTLFALDTLPCTPEPVRQRMRPVLNTTGLWQGTWGLFAPIPDNINHRLRADMFYADGSHRVWNSPDWRSQTAWQRFFGHRESEFLEKIAEIENSAAWTGFALSLVRRESPDWPPERIELSIRSGDIPPPGDVWPASTDPVPLDRERVFFTLVYR